MPSSTTRYPILIMLEEATVSYRRHWKSTVTQTSTHVYETAEGSKLGLLSCAARAATARKGEEGGLSS